MAEYLTSEQLKECKYYFDLLDKDSAGHLTVKEIGTVMKSIGLSMSEEELKMYFSELNSSSVNEIDFPNFVSLMTRKMRDIETEEELKRVFKEFDKSGKGYVTTEDLKSMCEVSGERYTVEELNEMITEADVDHDGVLNYDDFVRMMMAK